MARKAPVESRRRPKQKAQVQRHCPDMSSDEDDSNREYEMIESDDMF